MNKYKYYLNHLQKLKKLKKEKEINTNKKKYYEQDYEPNIDFIKKRVIIGPKWELLSGRKDSLKKLKDNAVLIKKSISKDKNVVAKQINHFNEGKKSKINIKKHILKEILSKKKDYSFETKLYNSNKKIKEKINSNNFNSSFMNNTNIINKKIKNKILSKNKSMINLNLETLKSKVYKLDNIKINDKYLSRYISPTSKTIIQSKKIQKKFTTVIKKNRNKFRGLNVEELKIINYIRKNRIKKLSKQNSQPNNLKIKNSKLWKKIISKEKDQHKQLKISNNYYNGTPNIKKSFNSYINRALLKYPENNINSLFLKKYNSKSFRGKINRFKEFYNFHCDKIDIYNFNKFDNITYKTLSVNKPKNNNFI